ncbi:MAG TPA: MFS transporter [Streptosporangiaceae bacterium]|nr:MFS transporter [Streptosporangiaceae bacterium]
MASRILIDLGPLRGNRGFRLLFAGQLVEVFGSQLTTVAIPFQVYALTRSSLQVGAVSLAQLGPLVLGALVGGTVGDAIDRRRILVVTALMMALTSGALAVNAASAHPSLVAIYLVSAAAAGVGGMASTASTAAVPSLVGPENLVAAYASMQVTDQVGLVVGPAMAGLLIEAVHLPWVYTIAAVIYLLTAVTVARIPAIPPAPGARRPGLGSIAEGLRYLRGRQALQGAYLIDINAMVFGMPRALFPALAASVFHGGPSTLGYLYAAPAAGALIGALTTGWLARIHRQGWAVIVAVCVWGAAIVAFGLVTVLWIALALLAVAGWADVISAVLRSTILQSSVPEEFRSRISSVQIAVVEGGPRLGDMESGAVASLVSTEFAIVSGGLACIAGAALLAGLLPGFRHYRARRGPGL